MTRVRVGTIRLKWKSGDDERMLEMVRVEGTNERPYSFGEGNDIRPIEVPSFLIATVPVTQPLWTHVMGAANNPSIGRGGPLPIENVSWDDITRPGGFLDRMNESDIRTQMAAQVPGGTAFRLPTETEWEYAARGGPHWPDGFRFSGSDDIDLVAWYDRKSGDCTKEVARKAPNPLGLYDMSGNVWEWCQDSFTRDVNAIPEDGSACAAESPERVLRGGCFHNWAIHCMVSKRYQIERHFHDGCIGFRLVASLK